MVKKHPNIKILGQKSVCPEATGHNFLLGNIIFGMRGPWDMSKKGFFPILKI